MGGASDQLNRYFLRSQSCCITEDSSAVQDDQLDDAMFFEPDYIVIELNLSELCRFLSYPSCDDRNTVYLLWDDAKLLQKAQLVVVVVNTADPAVPELVNNAVPQFNVATCRQYLSCRTDKRAAVDPAQGPPGAPETAVLLHLLLKRDE